jgi:ribonuclease P protein component
MVPKRWAKRAVTRNAIKRQIYTVSAGFRAAPACVPPTWCGCGGLRPQGIRERLVRRCSRQAVRGELQQLFEPAGAGAAE